MDETKRVYEIYEVLMQAPCLQGKHGMALTIALHLDRLGYRKLEGEPPLLLDEDIDHIDITSAEIEQFRKVTKIDTELDEAGWLCLAFSVITNRRVAKAQHDLILKWMRGEA